MTNKSGTAMAPSARERPIFDPFRNFEERIRRFFGETVDPFGKVEGENWSAAIWSPACDIYETEHEIVVKTELPEVKKEDIRISVDNNVITIHGERKFSEETKRENYHRLERSYGEFTRSFTLPNFIETGKINADFKEGILRVTLPKREEAKPKQVEVNVK
jgi:HSP20 family protein